MCMGALILGWAVLAIASVDSAKTVAIAKTNQIANPNPSLWQNTKKGLNSGESDYTSLLYFRARYYDPQTGEFISRDPFGYVDGMSLYRGYFVLGGVDPLGLCRNNCAQHCLDKYYTKGGMTTFNSLPPAKRLEFYNNCRRNTCDLPPVAVAPSLAPLTLSVHAP